MSITPQAVQKLLDEVEKLRDSRKRAWDNLQEIRWVLKDAAGIELPAPARKTIELESRIVKDGVRKTVKDRQIALDMLLKAIRIPEIHGSTIDASRGRLRPRGSGTQQGD
jgi:hypothetical protein